MFRSAFLFALICSTALLADAQNNLTLTQVQKAFDQANIPADAHITFDPSIFFEVIFSAGLGNETILQTPGTTLDLEEVAPTPSFAIKGSDLTSEFGYVVMAFDLDAEDPQTPLLSPYRHFLGGGFRVAQNDWASLEGWSGVASSTPPVTAWQSPAPLSVDPHRYVFLVYDQSAEFATQTLVNPLTLRILWNLSSFAEEVGLGAPIGGTFMLVGL